MTAANTERDDAGAALSSPPRKKRRILLKILLGFVALTAFVGDAANLFDIRFMIVEVTEVQAIDVTVGHIH